MWGMIMRPAIRIRTTTRTKHLISCFLWLIAYHGYIDLIGRRNVQDISAGVTFWPKSKKVMLKIENHVLSRAEKTDATYNAGGGVLRPASIEPSPDAAEDAQATPTREEDIGDELDGDGEIYRESKHRFRCWLQAISLRAISSPKQGSDKDVDFRICYHAIYLLRNGMSQVSITHLTLSPGHNYSGHHGREPDAHPIIEKDALECVAGRGIVGDRYFDFAENFKGQITFFDLAVFRNMIMLLGVEDRRPTVVRAQCFSRRR